MTYELERKYILNLNAFECGLLMGMIDKEKEFHFELREAKKHSLRDYLILKTMTIGDFRIGEVVGSATRHWVPSRKKWEPAEPNLKGLQIQDLQDDGIWIE